MEKKRYWSVKRTGLLMKLVLSLFMAFITLYLLTRIQLEGIDLAYSWIGVGLGITISLGSLWKNVGPLFSSAFGSTLVIMIVLFSLTSDLTVLDAWVLLFFGIVTLVVGRHLIYMDRVVGKSMPHELGRLASKAYLMKIMKGIIWVGGIFVLALIPLAFSSMADLGLSSIILMGVLVIALIISLGLLAQGKRGIPK